MIEQSYSNDASTSAVVSAVQRPMSAIDPIKIKPRQQFQIVMWKDKKKYVTSKLPNPDMGR